MNELTDVPIDRIPLSSLPGNLPPPRPPVSVSAPPLPPRSEPVAESPAPPAPPPPPQARWVREALRDLVKLNRKKGIALSAAGSLVTAALAMNALFSGASREPEAPAQSAPTTAQPVAQAAPPVEAQPLRDVSPPEPVAPAAPPTEKPPERRESATAIPLVDIKPIPTPAPPRTIEPAAAAPDIKAPDVVVAAPAPSPTDSATGGIKTPLIVPAVAREPAAGPASSGGVVVAATVPPAAAPKPPAGGNVTIPPPQDLTKLAPITPTNINPVNPATDGVKPPTSPAMPTVKPEPTPAPDVTVPVPKPIDTKTPKPGDKPVPLPVLPIGDPKTSAPGAAVDNKTIEPPVLNVGNTKPDLPTPMLDDKKINVAVPPIGGGKLDPPAKPDDKLYPDVPAPSRPAAEFSPPTPKLDASTIPPPVPSAPIVEKTITPVEAPKPQPAAPSPFGGMNDPATTKAPATAAPKLLPPPGGESVRFTKPPDTPDVRQTGAKNLPPARTSFDVDIHYPKAGETYSSISKLHYGDARYAAALQQFNRGRVFGQGDSIQIPPMYVLRQRATPGAPPARPTSNGLEWASSGPTTTAPTYNVPRDGMTMWDVAADLYGDRQHWRKVWDVNQRIDPNAILAKGTKLQLPPDARQ
jgi:hypothetical protein